MTTERILQKFKVFIKNFDKLIIMQSTLKFTQRIAKAFEMIKSKWKRRHSLFIFSQYNNLAICFHDAFDDERRYDDDNDK